MKDIYIIGFILNCCSNSSGEDNVLVIEERRNELLVYLYISKLFE